MHKVVGWDIGGAHVKVVLLDEAGKLLQSQQIACSLWLGVHHLESAVTTVLTSFGLVPKQAKHAVTMTGELVDLFANRHEGVVKIANVVEQQLGQGVLFYGMNREQHALPFFTLADVGGNTSMIASANWHASASLLAQQLPSALLVDIGSTTTDIIVIDGGMVRNGALTDAERMQQDTLVYTGVVRTPVMAVAQKLSWDGLETNVAAEYFATMADVYRLTAELPAVVDMADTADGEDKSMLASARRLARMVGYDVEDKALASWQQLAHACRLNQINQLKVAMTKQLTTGMMVVGAGAGEFLVRAMAATLQRPYTDVSHALQQQADLSVCLPAYAVAKLAHRSAA